MSRHAASAAVFAALGDPQRMLLEAAGLARCEKSGRETLWKLDKRPPTQAREHLDRIARQWDAAIERLRAFVEEDRHADA